MAYGGPRNLEEVEPFLQDILGGRRPPLQMVAAARERYRLIGGRSPLPEVTEAQARALEVRLNQGQEGKPFRVYVGMRHSTPRIGDAVEQIAADGYQRVVALCLTPQYSRLSVGAYFQQVAEARQALGTGFRLTYIPCWHLHPLFLRALASLMREALEGFPNRQRGAVRVVFTAHSLPAPPMADGDPYEAHVLATARAVAALVGLGTDEWHLAYQCAGDGPTPWLGPSLEEVLARLGEASNRQVLIVPVGYVSDSAEILYDIDIACQELARRHGIHLRRSASLNAAPGLIAALADLVCREAFRT